MPNLIIDGRAMSVPAGTTIVEAAREADVDIAPMNLQNVFVSLCGHGDAR